MDKKRRQSSSSSSSLMSEQPEGTNSELSVSSQASDDESTAPTVVSMKSDRSKGHPLSFGTDPVKGAPESGSASASPSVVSIRSTRSKGHPLSFGADPVKGVPESGSVSASPSVVSMRSTRSKGHPLSFGADPVKGVPVSGSASASPSVVSMKSDRSKGHPLSFGDDPFKRKLTREPSRCSVCEEESKDLLYLDCGHWSCKQCVSSDKDQCSSPADHYRTQCGKKSRRDPEHHKDTEEDSQSSRLLEDKKTLKEEMKRKFTWAQEGNGDQESSLKTIYTELLVSTGESEGPHEEHTFRQSEHKLKQSSKQSINLRDIFKPLPGHVTPHRTVLMKGIAGIGKSFSVQKFILDWAEERANQDIDFIFCLSFREINLSRDNKSLHMLLSEFHPALESFKHSEDFSGARVMVILDGLDESRFQLDFENKTVASVSEVASVGSLLANLIKGNLLPGAKLWITSRPAAANQIPAEFVDLVTEIRGFSDEQKEEYFRKQFSQDSSLADRIILHIRSSQTLDIMCQIPIFCWISSILFEEVFGEHEKSEVPQTLTEMMAHFLFVQTKRRNRKYKKKTEENTERLLTTHREFLLRLGKLAFVQLLKNNLIFYAEDLEECGINVTEATTYSGFCNAVLQREVYSQNQVFFFVHLTIQEFFAALFVFDCFTKKKTEELSDFLDLKDKEQTLLDLLKVTVEEVLKKKNGHLDFFLRFLLGLMVESNRRILQGLLTPPDPREDTEKKILTYLKTIRRKALSPDSCINLFQTMVEMRDHKIKDEIQDYLKSPYRSKTELTPLHCSALAYMLQVSKDNVDVLDLKSYNTSDEGRRRLIPAVRSSRVAILADCKVTEEWIEHLAFGLKFPYLPLRVLDLSNNDLKDSGVQLLCDGLSSQHCKMETLKLSGCLITEEGCASLASALKSNPSHLNELDLSYNNLGESGEKLLFDLRNDPQYKLSKLNVEHGGVHRMKPGFKKYARELTFDPNTVHKNLLLSERNRKVTWEKEEQPHPDHKERFDHCQQVLCEQALDGRCYWEVDVLGPCNIGLTYKTIDRKGDGNVSKLGRNKESWCLTCCNDVLHENQSLNVSSLYSRSSRVGVYLDWPAGILSFYKVSSGSRIRLHTFKTEFKKPLYPAIELHTRSSASLCQLT